MILSNRVVGTSTGASTTTTLNPINGFMSSNCASFCRVQPCACLASVTILADSPTTMFSPTTSDTITVTFTNGSGVTQTQTLTPGSTTSQLSLTVPINACVPINGPLTATASFTTTAASPAAIVTVIATFDNKSPDCTKNSKRCKAKCKSSSDSSSSSSNQQRKKLKKRPHAARKNKY